MVMLMSWQGWRAAFYLLGALSLVWVAAWALYFRDDPKRHRFVTARELARLPPYQPAVRGAAAVPWGPVVRRMLPTTIVFFCVPGRSGSTSPGCRASSMRPTVSTRLEAPSMKTPSAQGLPKNWSRNLF